MNIKNLFVIGTIVLAACAPVSKKSAQENVAVALSGEEQIQIQNIEAIGRDLYIKDIYTANANDLLLEKINREDYPGFVGWTAREFAGHTVVSFYEKINNQYGLIADVNYDREGYSSIDLKPERALLEGELSMIKARVTALQAGWNGCSDKFNTVVLDSEDGKSWHVYVLAATIDPDIVMAGGHSRIAIDKQTGQLLEKHGFSKSCLALNKSEGLPEGATLEYMMLTHIVDDIPAPTHVYLNLLHKQSLMVVTSRGTWLIEEGKISLK